MKTTAKTLALVLAFLSLAVAGITPVNLAKANPALNGGKPNYAVVSIQSPQNTTGNDNTTTVYGGSVQLSFTVKTNFFSEITYSAGDCFIVLDSKSVAFNGFRVMGGMTIADDNGYRPYDQWTLTGDGSISNLANGTHRLEVNYNSLSSASVLFDVESDIASGSEPIISMLYQPPTPTVHNDSSIYPPFLTVLSPSQYGIYNTSDVPLNVTVQISSHGVEPQIWLNYSLDGQNAVPMSLILPSESYPTYYVRGNGILAGLSNGKHNLTIYGETITNGLTQNFNRTVRFSVNAPKESTADAFPTSIVAVASGSTTAVVGIGLLVYFKKRRRG